MTEFIQTHPQLLMIALIFIGAQMVWPVLRGIMRQPAKTWGQKNRRGGKGLAVWAVFAGLLVYVWMRTGGVERTEQHVQQSPGSLIAGGIVGGLLAAWFLFGVLKVHKGIG